MYGYTLLLEYITLCIQIFRLIINIKIQHITALNDCLCEASTVCTNIYSIAVRVGPYGDNTNCTVHTIFRRFYFISVRNKITL